jgi:putative transcriptional regulator
MKNKVMISLRGSRTQREIAKQLEISPSMYHAIENNKRFPSKKLLEKITKFYNVSVEELFFSK